MQQALESLVEALESAPRSRGAASCRCCRRRSGEQVLSSSTRRERAYPQEKLIHELFEEQVERTPDAVAVVYEEQR